ncbi:MAG: LysM peptidoglycan-binding domain-containing protein [Bacteroidales bacterium]|nr:LysM peptidoglycan-binding domain-containing protein [Bacteroidales bacterium]
MSQLFIIFVRSFYEFFKNMNIVLKYLLSGILLCFCILSFAQNQEYPIIKEGDMEFYLYSPEQGEGIYSVSRKFGVPLNEIIRYNPSLENGLKKGSQVLVPIQKEDASKTYHIIAPKETLYGVSKMYNITPEELMAANPGLNNLTFSIGKRIEIPVSIQENKPEQRIISEQLTGTSRNHDEYFQREEKIIRYQDNTEMTNEKKERYSVVLMLPFTGKGESASKNNRFIEYYEGFLLAVDSMKAKGLSLDLYVYNTGISGQSVKQLLRSNTLKNADLIIGGTNEDEITSISDFTKNTGSKYIVPFSSRGREELLNPNLFQVNPAQNLVQAKAAEVYASLFRDNNVILINWADDKNSKQEFIHSLRSNLNNNHTSFFSINYSDNLMNDIKSYLDPNRKNIVLPTSSSLEALTGIAPTLRLLSSTDSVQIVLYGYPEWQVYAKDIIEDLFLLDTHFYTTFYANNTSAEIKDFYNKYKYWYRKSLLNTYPKYGMLGFDTGMYFLNALRKFGPAFDQHLNECSIPLLQTSFNFRNYSEEEGFVNMNLFIVQFNPDFTLKKSIIR